MDAEIVRLLGLDQSQEATGWSVGGLDDAPPKSGVFRSAPWGKKEGAGILRFGNWLIGTIEKYHITAVCYEEPYIPKVTVDKFGKKRGNTDIDALKPMIFLEGEINRVCAKMGVPVKVVAISQWRSRFLGTTKASPGLTGKDARADLKAKAVAACAELGWYVESHDEAEARGIMVYGLGDLSPDYAHKTDPHARRAALKQMNKEFRGEA